MMMFFPTSQFPPKGFKKTGRDLVRFDGPITSVEVISNLSVKSLGKLPGDGKSSFLGCLKLDLFIY